MSLLTWWKGKVLPSLAPLTGFRASPAEDLDRVIRLAQLSPSEAQARLAQGHTCYIAYLGDEPTAYGWVARQQAAVGELQLEFVLGPNTAYLWDFATLPAWQGRGIYPLLLQAILRAEEARQFWIMHAPENGVSARGIRRAGFAPVGTISFRADATVALAATDNVGQALVAAQLLHIPPLVPKESLNPCWRCFIARLRAYGQPTRLCGQQCSCAEVLADLPYGSDL